jgi:hypothetical protein
MPACKLRNIRWLRKVSMGNGTAFVGNGDTLFDLGLLVASQSDLR